MSIILDALNTAKQFLSRRRYAYVKTFNGPLGQEVLADLVKFCRARESTFHPDPRVHAVLEGRREVFLRIQQHLQLTDDELWTIYGQAPQPQNRTNNE
jgi:hypothetical protein